METNRLRTPKLTDCGVNTCEYYRKGICEKRKSILKMYRNFKRNTVYNYTEQ